MIRTAALVIALIAAHWVKNPNPVPQPPIGCNPLLPAGDPKGCCPTEAACPIK